MAKFNIDGLTYTDKLPHSRIERILYQILKNGGGGGGDVDPDAVVVDGPEDLGNGLLLDGNVIKLNVSNSMDDSKLPITSNAVFEQLEIADSIMARI